MTYKFPEGGKFLYSITFEAAKTLSTMSNANPCSAASAAHGYSDGDEIMLTSGWEEATDSVYKVDQTDTGNFLILGLDTSDTTQYSAGGGSNSTAKKITGNSWVEVPQVLTIDSQGGDPRMGTVNPVFKRQGVTQPLGFNPVTINMNIGHDASNATYLAMLGISRRRQLCAFKQQLADGSVTYGYGYMSVGEFPKLQAGNANQVPVVIAIQGRAISY